MRPSCPRCGWVYYEDPKVAVAALIVKQGRVLLVRRAIQPSLGRWTIPAGFLNAHEDAKAALVRECMEETGLQVEVGEIIKVISGREHARGADILLVYRVVITGGILRAGDDADAADFFDPTDLPPLAFHSTSEILKQLGLDLKN